MLREIIALWAIWTLLCPFLRLTVTWLKIFLDEMIDETFIVRLSVISQSKARFDQCKITKTSSHSSEAGSHKTSHMRDHFEEIGRLARMLKVGDNSEVKDTGRWDHAEGDKVRKIWSHEQSQTFADLRHTMFKFVTGKHELTRTARLKVYHPVLYHRLDKSKIILALEFGPRLGHILTSCGETDKPSGNLGAITAITPWGEAHSKYSPMRSNDNKSVMSK